jgi:predicted nucleotidyltransferase
MVGQRPLKPLIGVRIPVPQQSYDIIIFMQEKIIDYLKSEYEPEVILLGGSRMKGRETEQSDWDLFLMGSKKGAAGFVEFEGQRLDVTFKNWPEEDKPLTIPTGPLWPIKVVFDESQGKLGKVLSLTEEYFNKGPFTLYKESVLGRFDKLDSWKRKIEKHANNPMVEFWYAGVFYEFAIRIWFELRNRWSLSPTEAIQIIQEEDKSFYDLLASFVSVNSIERPKYTRDILSALEISRSEALK